MAVHCLHKAYTACVYNVARVVAFCSRELISDEKLLGNNGGVSSTMPIGHNQHKLLDFLGVHFYTYSFCLLPPKNATKCGMQLQCKQTYGIHTTYNRDE